MERVELIVPNVDNDGQAFDSRLVEELQHKLLVTVGGFTIYTAIGQWISESTVYVDHNRVYVLDIQDSTLFDSVVLIAKWVKTSFRQQAVYLTRQRIDTTLI